MDRPSYVSVSQLNVYLACGLKYRFQYIDRLPKTFRPSALALGSAIHAAVEWLNRERIDRKDPTLEELFQVFDSQWETETQKLEIRFKEGETYEEFKQKAREMLRLYYEQGPRSIQSAEVPFEVPLIHTETGEVLPVLLKGYIDFIEEDGIIGELKTSSTTWPDNLKYMLQLTAYHYAYSILFKEEPRGIKLINLTKAKTPKIEILSAERSVKDHNRFFSIIKEFLKAVDAGIFLPNPSYRCKECEYNGICQEWKGNE